MFLSKIRYGLQLLGCVRWKENDTISSDIEAIQKCQNKLLRVLNGSVLSEKISTKSMLVKFKVVNQMLAQIKLSEMWKSTHIANYPIKTELLPSQEQGTNTRARTSGLILKESKSTFSSQKNIHK